MLLQCTIDFLCLFWNILTSDGSAKENILNSKHLLINNSFKIFLLVLEMPIYKIEFYILQHEYIKKTLECIFTKIFSLYMVKNVFPEVSPKVLWPMRIFPIFEKCYFLRHFQGWNNGYFTTLLQK